MSKECGVNSHWLTDPGVTRVDTESRLRKLESQYRTALSAAVSGIAHYLALTGEPSATATAIERAKSYWQQLESRKRVIAARMGEIEALENDTTAS